MNRASLTDSDREEKCRYRCRVCDRLVEGPQLVCNECWYRDLEEQKREFELEPLDEGDASPAVILEYKNGRTVKTRIRPELKSGRRRKGYEI